MLRADFLVLHYGTFDLLFARDTLYASTFRKPCEGVTGRARVSFGQKAILDIDLDSYVRHLFPSASASPPHLGAVCKAADLAGGSDQLEGEELFSLAIPSDSEVRALELSEFRPLPFHLRPCLDRHGLRALRFEGSLIQFFCDAGVFIPGCLAFHQYKGDNDDRSGSFPVGSATLHA
ncbi:MAG: hypothetical protein WCG80_04550 [Spirochaetales bacterium]